MSHKLKLIIALLAALMAVSCGRSAEDYVSRGTSALEAGNVEEAELNFRKAIQKDSKQGKAFLGLGQTAMRRNDFSEAFRAFSAAVELMPNDPTALKNLGEVLMGAYLVDPSHPEELKTRLVSVIQRIAAAEPQSPDAHKMLGLVASAEKKYAEALEHFRKANSMAPSDPSLKILEAQALADSGKPGEAEEMVRALVQANPDFSPAYDWLMRRYNAANRTADVERVLLSKIEANPSEINYQLQLAQWYYQRGQRGAMESVIQGITTKQKDTGIPVGDFYALLGERDAALRFYREAANQSSTKAAASKRMAPILANQGKVDDALKLIAEVRGADRNDDEATRIEADLRVRKGTPDQIKTAIQTYGTLLERRPSDPQVRFSLAMAYTAAGDQANARQELERSITHNPGHLPAVNALAQTYRQAGQYRDMLVLAERILAQDKSHSVASLLRAEALTKTGRPAEARSVLRAMTPESSTAIDRGLLLANALIAERDLERAEQQLRELYRPGSSDVRVLQSLSDVLTYRGRRNDVLALWKNELTRAPQALLLQKGFAKASYLAEQHAQAIATYRQVLAADPNDVESSILMAAAMYASGSQKEAIETFKRAAELPTANTAFVESILAYLYGLEGNGPAAELYYRRALEKDPENPVLLNNLGFILADRGQQLDEAQRLASKAIGIEPSNPGFADTVAMIALKKGAVKDAAGQFAALVNKYPKHPEFRFHHGLALLEMGQVSRAREEMAQALQSNPPPDLEGRIKKALSSPPLRP